jgi:ubiquinone/menaquinone biosynthesis C-methylase UbiE
MLPNWWIFMIEEYRANRIAASLAQFVDPGETVLDCGCGSMSVAQALHKQTGAKILGSDVIAMNRTDLSMSLCPGEWLSFASKSVGTVLLVSVLHHTTDPLKTLNECLRVARRRVIIQEDVYRNAFERWLLGVLDWVCSRAVSDEISLPNRFQSEGEWRQIFADLSVDLVAARSVRPIPWQPSRHRLFVLDKRNAQP